MYELGKRFATCALDHLAKYTYTVSAGEGCTLSASTLFTDGDPVSFTYTLARGKLLGKVTLNGVDITSSAVEGNTVTLTPSEDTAAFNEVEISTSDAQKYKLTVDLGVGGKIVNRSISGSTIYEGDVLSFRLEPDKGYEADKVEANGSAVLPDSTGLYTVEIGAGDVSVSVTFRQTVSELPEEPKDPPKEGGCGGVIGAGAGLAGLLLACGAVLFMKKK